MLIRISAFAASANLSYVRVTVIFIPMAGEKAKKKIKSKCGMARGPDRRVE